MSELNLNHPTKSLTITTNTALRAQEYASRQPSKQFPKQYEKAHSHRQRFSQLILIPSYINAHRASKDAGRTVSTTAIVACELAPTISSYLSLNYED